MSSRGGWRTGYIEDSPSRLNDLEPYCHDCGKRVYKSILEKDHRGHNVTYEKKGFAKHG